jgi:hypothetical protein
MNDQNAGQNADDSTVLSAVTKMLEARIPVMSEGLHERYGNEVGEQAVTEHQKARKSGQAAERGRRAPERG